MRIGVAYAVSLISFLLIDLGRATAALSLLGHDRSAALLLDRPSFAPMLVFHLLQIAGLVFFAVAPALVAHRWPEAAWRGAVFGALAFTFVACADAALLHGKAGLLRPSDVFAGTFASVMAATAGYFGTLWLLG